MQKSSHAHPVFEQARHWKNSIEGLFIADIDYNILIMNDKALSILNIETSSSVCFSDIFKLEQKTSEQIEAPQGKNQLNFYPGFENHKKILQTIQDIILKDKISVQFVGFWPYKNEFKSLLFHLIPIFDEIGNVCYIQGIITEYTMWGLHEYLKIYEYLKANFLTILPSNFKFAIRLPQRQHEILFLLTNGVSQRMAAQILNISYGSLSKIVRYYIIPKFNLQVDDTKELIKVAKSFEYHKYIPQSLCRPCLIILNPDLIVKYFAHEQPKDWISLKSI